MQATEGCPEHVFPEDNSQTRKLLQLLGPSLLSLLNLEERTVGSCTATTWVTSGRGVHIVFFVRVPWMYLPPRPAGTSLHYRPLKIHREHHEWRFNVGPSSLGVRRQCGVAWASPT